MPNDSPSSSSVRTLAREILTSPPRGDQSPTLRLSLHPRWIQACNTCRKAAMIPTRPGHRVTSIQACRRILTWRLPDARASKIPLPAGSSKEVRGSSSRSTATFSRANSRPLVHRTTTSVTLMCYSFGRVTVSERVFPRRMEDDQRVGRQYTKDSAQSLGHGTDPRRRLRSIAQGSGVGTNREGHRSLQREADSRRGYS